MSSTKILDNYEGEGRWWEGIEWKTTAELGRKESRDSAGNHAGKDSALNAAGKDPRSLHIHEYKRIYPHQMTLILDRITDI